MQKSILIPIIIILFGFVACKTKKKAPKEDKSSIEKAEKAMDRFGKTMDFASLPDTLKVAHLTRRWNGCNSLRFVDSLHHMYADQVHFYGEGKKQKPMYTR